MMLVSLPVSAQVESMVDLYGKYKFTSKMEVTEAGKAYETNFAAESDVVITSSDGSTIISGIAGATNGSHTIVKINTSENQLIIYNWNGWNASYWTGDNVWMSNADGIYPYGWGDMPQLGNLNITYDPATKNMTMPDFTLVSVDNAAATAVVLAKFTDCKLTLVESEKIEIADISGSWHAAAQGQYGSKADSEYPSEYNFVLTKTQEESRKHSYDVALSIEGLPTVNLTGTFDGVSLNIPLDSVVFDAEKKIIAVNYNSGNPHTSFGFDYLSERTMEMSGILCLAQVMTGKDSEGNDSTYLEYAQWFSSGVAKKEVPASEKFDWSGTWNVKVNNPEQNLLVFDGSTFPSEFKMVISYYDVTETYYVEEFLGYNNTALTYGGIKLTPSADDPNVAELETGKLIATIEPAKLYWKLYDGTGRTGTVKFTANEDGTISIGDFFVQTMNYETNVETPSAMYQYSITATKEEVKPFDFVGKFTIKATPTPVKTDYEYPSEFGIEITYSDVTEKYYLTTFLGNDIYTMNQGGIPCEREGDVLKIATGDNRYIRKVGNNADYTTMWYDSFFEPEGKGGSFVTLTGNADGTLTLGDFHVYRTTINYDASWNATKTSELACKYTGATGTTATGIEDVVATPVNTGAEGIYTLSGMRVGNNESDFNALPGGIYIIKNGQKSIKVVR